ncbi:MAG TPA: putative porin, partial [Rhizobacter sp.]|nr:putative porin [Rhizobacter sp.]
MNFFSFRPIALLALAVCAAPSMAAPEADAEAVRAATVKLINLLIDQGVLTREKAEALLNELNKPAAAPPPAVRVPYMPEFMRKELKDEVQLDLAAQAAREGWAKAGSVPAWVRSLEWEGDLRTRYQFDNYAPGNDPAVVKVGETNRTRALTLLNDTEDRRRFRVRARAGLTAKVDENWAAGIRLTTGSLSDPLSSNQTLGVYDNRFTAAFDRAYIRFRYGDSFNAVMGRFGNPWFGTDLVWANDLGFDGVALQWTPALTPKVRGFATVAAMPIQEVELSTADKWLYGVQIGATRAGSA